MSQAILSRAVGEPIKIIAPGGYESTVTLKSFKDGVAEFCIESPPAIWIADESEPIDLYSQLSKDEQNALNAWLSRPAY